MLARDPVDVSQTNTDSIATIEVAHQLKRRGVEAKIIIGDSSSRTASPDRGLVSLIARAHHWLEELTGGGVVSISDLASRENMDRSEISRFLPLAFLAPDIVEAILIGRQPVDLTIKKLRRIASVPLGWADQKALLGFAG
jgi:hypothetical protein